ncbi:MAG: scyllo-inositol 2-dehydrogenase (NAD(+)) [Fimbriimonadaceae bacterium]|nr:scyllo-inositol 2-dehydrogenase (NAD(+)) [Fimbriimonadaceae bacterium]
MRVLAFVGCGHIHTPGFVEAIKQRGTPVKAVADWDPDRATATAEALGAVVAEPDAIRDDPDIGGVVVTSHTVDHRAIVDHLAPSGKALFVEKPIGMSGEDALAIAATLERHGNVFQTGYRMRGEANAQTAKHLVDSGALGQITRARAAVCHHGALDGWFDDRWRWMADLSQAGVGAFGDLGTHGLDILMWLFGPVESVTAALANGTARYPDCDELGEGILRFRSGVVATLAASWDDWANPLRLEITGTEGHLSWFDGKLTLKLRGADPVTPELQPAKSAGFDAFLDWAEGKDADLLSPVEAASRCVAMHAMYTSARNGKWKEIG